MNKVFLDKISTKYISKLIKLHYLKKNQESMTPNLSSKRLKKYKKHTPISQF